MELNRAPARHWRRHGSPPRRIALRLGLAQKMGAACERK
jgi:hypothetical protein